MTLQFEHFDTRLNEWLHSDGDRFNPNSRVAEQLDNTLLEFFLPERDFSFGQMDEKTTAAELKNHPDGDVLLLSSKSRLLYGDRECLPIIEKLCPDRKDRGAYGSIFLGSCTNSVKEELNVLVVDDATGENGGYLEKTDAWKLVGDCYGQISPQLYDKLTNRQVGESYRVIQHRFGWQAQTGSDPYPRFGKGTLRPHDLSKVDWKQPVQVELILPISSFKGTDKDNPNGPQKPQIAPGLYKQTIWLGAKALSQKGKTAISQLLPSFPHGIKDFVETIEAEASSLAKIQHDPRRLAQLYCEKYEERQKARDVDSEEIESEDIDPATDSFMYQLLKADLAGHCQLLETEKVKRELNRFVRKQWLNIAIGRTINFDRAMIIPSKDLKNGEICVPWIDAGEKVLNFRSPFLNSNGLCVSTNVRVSDYQGPDGKPLKGVIVVNDETLERIKARLQENEIAPLETESERQGRDYDGDCLGVELARKYPNLAIEAQTRNLPENAYPPTVKLKKQSFYKEEGSQPEFEDIAIFMAKSDVGFINNQVTALEALESEIEVVKTWGTSETKANYINQVATHYQKLLDKEKNLQYEDQITKIITLAHDPTPENILEAIEINRTLYRDLIAENCFQNQLAVDTFKSARAPDVEQVKQNRRYLYRNVNYLKDKKNPTAYLNKGITIQGHSPVELLIDQTNKYFNAAQLESRPYVQFKDLFQGVEFTDQQKLAVQVCENEYNRAFIQATKLSDRLKTEQGPFAVVRIAPGQEIEITNLINYDYQNIQKIRQAETLDLRFQAIPIHKRSNARPHQLLALGKIDGKYVPIGTVCEQSVIDYSLKPGQRVADAKVWDIRPELSEGVVKVLFQKAQKIAINFYGQLPESERLQYAAAAWKIATKENYTEDRIHKKANNFVFAAFPQEVLSRLDKLQLKTLQTSFIQPTELPVEIEIGKGTRINKGLSVPTRTISIKDSQFPEPVYLLETSARLPVGTKARAKIKGGESYTLKATIVEPNQPPIEFTIREISKFSYRDRLFGGEQVKLTLQRDAIVPSQEIEVSINGQKIGKLAPESVVQFYGIDRPSNETVRASLQFNLKERKSYAIAQLPDGVLLKIDDVKNIEGIANTNKCEINLAPLPGKRQDIVLLDGKILGVLHIKKEREALARLGILKVGKGTSISCHLENNFTHSFLQIDPASVEYPKKWEKTTATPQLASSTSSCEQILAQLKTRPTVLFNSQEDKVFGLVGLAVDDSKAALVEQWLATRAIDCVRVPSKQAGLATRKGLAVYSLSKSTIDEKNWQLLLHRFGSPLEAGNKDSPYQQFLQSLPNRQLDCDLPPPSLPTLWATEDYEWEVERGHFVEQPTIRIAVDRNKSAVVTNYFNNVEVAPTLASEEDASQESKLGYEVFRIPASSIPSMLIVKLTKRLGLPLNANRDGTYYKSLATVEQQLLQRYAFQGANDVEKQNTSTNLYATPESLQEQSHLHPQLSSTNSNNSNQTQKELEY